MGRHGEKAAGTAHEKRLVARLRRKYLDKFDLVAMAMYLCVVFVWGLRVYPLGRDFSRLAKAGEGLPFLVGRLLAWEVAVFDTNVVGYHVVNLALLYACMVCLYYLVWLTVKGPPWLGSLAATLFMANPVHSEAVLNLSGVVDLLPCLFALAALLFYAWHAAGPRPWKLLVGLALLGVASVPHQVNAALVVVVILYEFVVVPPGARRYSRLAAFGLVGFLGFCIHAGTLFERGFSPAHMFGPLYFIVYPIGFLPETARAFHERPWLGWVGAAAVLLVVGLIHRKARRKAILFGLSGMAAVCLFQGGRFVDPVHLVGGGRLLLPNALFNVAFVALCLRMMEHPKWRKPLVTGTTMLCVVFFALEIRSIRAWNYAGREVRAFQVHAAGLVEGAQGEPIGLVPDYQYYLGAPLCFSQAVAYDTPFSEAIPVVSLVPLHADKSGRMQVEILRWSNKQGTAVVTGVRPLDLVPWPYALAREGGKLETQNAAVEALIVDEAMLTLSIKPKTGALPMWTLPVSAGQQAAESNGPDPGQPLGEPEDAM